MKKAKLDMEEVQKSQILFPLHSHPDMHGELEMVWDIHSATKAMEQYASQQSAALESENKELKKQNERFLTALQSIDPELQMSESQANKWYKLWK